MVIWLKLLSHNVWVAQEASETPQGENFHLSFSQKFWKIFEFEKIFNSKN